MALWSGILAPTRGIDWSYAGVVGGIPTTRSQYGTTISAYTGTAGTINTRISQCSAAGGGIVQLASGTFNLTTTIIMLSNVTLRGQGMSTILNFTNIGGSGYYWGAGEIAIVFKGDYTSTWDSSAPGMGGANPSNTKTFSGTNGDTGTFTQGATVLNFGANVTGSPNLAVGDILYLWQTDDASSTAGYFVSDAVCREGSGWTQGTGQQQRLKVLGVSGAQVTVASPGLYLSAGTWRAAQSPKGAWWGGDVRMAGVENLLVRTTSLGEHWGVIEMWQSADCWVKGVGLQAKYTSYGAGGACRTGIRIFESRNCTVKNCFLDTMTGGGFSSTTSYGIETIQASGCLIENNIFKNVDSPILMSSGTTGCVIAYNHDPGAGCLTGILSHEEGCSMNLYEGNGIGVIRHDTFHGNSNFTTMNRNHVRAFEAGIDIWSYGRYINAVGNVLAHSTQYQALATDATKRDRYYDVAFRLGYAGGGTGSPEAGVSLDSVVWSTIMRWGNYDAANNAVREVAGEKGDSAPSYPALASPTPYASGWSASFYRASQPGFFTVSGVARPWPLIGPDVTGGNVSGLGGHANKTPAQTVYESISGVLASFDPSVYGEDGGASPPVGTPVLSVR